ncbi:hypothetical protein [Roseisalinus antarcticus]|uniref:Uncharacterized protein n=1 Tax=Roseisalinus antarcticus TaxID=254357 RepID=A0A1Y5T8I4_9RHOB|nr:hypothetical protein [Roseisalinus antarcticus]SLN58288.1 hypothetical protein ROA7023_02672 [Roseisalinus antarcticus]
MTRLFLAAAVALTGVAPLAAGAQTLSTRSQSVAPPASYTAQHWTDPRTGCSYSRAQAPGYAPTWHLIMNGAQIGLTNARAGCAGMLTSRN